MEEKIRGGSTTIPEDFLLLPLFILMGEILYHSGVFKTTGPYHPLFPA